MINITLNSNAEKRAEKAENLQAFSGLKLLHVKKQVASILNQIGKDGIFDEYTKHDISHIDYMLKSLDMIIPQDTQDKLTPSEWLMMTLSIYFHDLGMLVTKEEFTNRDSTPFKEFAKQIADGHFGLDFRDKIYNLGRDQRDRFIYQEYVRRTHAERIKLWILNGDHTKEGGTRAIREEIAALTINLDNMFRRDLALICESHHLSDLDNFEKYKPGQQYGPSEFESVNVHYCALILRTADLLHITSDRTPSIEFKLINPTDPVSQEEWAKQRNVKAVRPKVKTNTEGILDVNIPPDTFEIIALFEQEEGFFGLISYLNYASKQLKESYKYNEICNKTYGKTYQFPWRNIDDSNIETQDFERKQFEFLLDQQKILDLLVGHTLYNEPSVILRELTQNAIDASKLQQYELSSQKDPVKYIPKIVVNWNSNKKELSFTDNGTGMTLEIIQNHLLKVGSSRYQDDNFKRKYPDFSPISRFGIGLLTCFLIADDVDITTKYNDNDKGIQLKIRKVHGKYLLKYLANNQLPTMIQNHGTEIKLYVRSEINLDNIEGELQKWILFPNCEIVLDVDGVLKTIGYKSPKEYLEERIEALGFDLNVGRFKVIQAEKDGVTLAYALRYIEHWKEWGFLEYTERDDDQNISVGTCIEGIRVDFDTPGFQGHNIFAIANSSGKNAPKTNVARSNIEITPEREHLLLVVYQLYLAHLNKELQRLKTENSVTWAAKEVNYLLYNFSQGNRHLRNGNAVLEEYQLFKDALATIEFVLIEDDLTRSLISVNNLIELKHFWTIQSASYMSADSLVKEVKSSTTSAIQILKTIYSGNDSNMQHLDRVLCSERFNSEVNILLREKFQVTEIKLIPEQRRIDLKWEHIKDIKWEEVSGGTNDSQRSLVNTCYIQKHDIEGISDLEYTAIFSNDYMFLLNNSPINQFMLNLNERLKSSNVGGRGIAWTIISIIESCYSYKQLTEKIITDVIENRINRNGGRQIWEIVNKPLFIEALQDTNFKKYDTTIWSRRDLY
jgi:molecular chaperone HtpG